MTEGLVEFHPGVSMTRLAFELFRYCPACGAPQTEARGNPFVCSECAQTLYFNSATATAAIVTDGGPRVLLLERGRDPHRGKLGLPGGFVDLGECAEEALRREIHEEIGLHVSQLDYLASFANTYDYRGVRYCTTDFFYIGVVRDFDGIRIQASEIAGYRCVRPGPAELDAMAFPSNRRAVELFLERG